ncbi:hypothetical protein [Chitinivibrio alkaliphilus]|uniref:Uncharacterized protein n=1 Tax=Chitinivibrio alkaliphilus ACht1 TaxID=1313304 RepID=U7D8K9_9BACT|nr:hypothetical protein [Chitinivibrio alkaliphilus]ERP38734.1 hypothetical protein CALK_0752 [Chitinivibrio alkaliphilus ACht1]
MLLGSIIVFVCIQWLGAVEVDWHGSLRAWPMGVVRDDQSWSVLRTGIRGEGEFFFPRGIRGGAVYELAPRLYSENTPSDLRGYNEIPHEGYRVGDFSAVLLPDSPGDDAASVIYHDLDRLYISVPAGAGRLTLGRQSLGWGSSFFVSPTDIIAPFTFTAVDSEFRRGVDGLVFRLPWGAMNELEAGYVGGDSFAWEKSAAFMRTRLVHSTLGDISPICIVFQENVLAGIDYEKSILDAGFSLEMAHVFSINSEKEDHEDDDYFRLTTGLLYRFTPRLTLRGEYHYNGASLSAEDYITARTQGQIYLKNTHYGGVQKSFEITPLTLLSTHVLAAVEDPSVSVGAMVETSLRRRDNIVLSAAFQGGIGGDSAEFSSAHRMVYGGIRWYL